MDGPLIFFEPEPPAGELPAAMPSPFDPGPPHPLARRAAELLVGELERGDPLPRAAFEEPHRSKMFAVLVVVAPGGRVGFLRGFSGMLGGRWEVPGFVGPLFDLASRDRMWPAAEAELVETDRRLEALSRVAATDGGRLQEMVAAQARQAAELAARHRERREHRRQARLRGVEGAALHALAQESRGDTAAERRQRQAHARQRAPLEQAVAALEAEASGIRRRRQARSCELLEEIFEGYQIPNARGERRSLRSLFAPETPPGGSGDCAAPKLLGHAHRQGLRPVALAELWWGAPPLSGGRHHGLYYPACRGKCGPVLAHMLDGLAVAPPPRFEDEIAADEPRLVYEDQWLVVVNKPAGLLSVPGRRAASDSAQSRLQARHPGLLLVHRLDLDVSGLLLAAKDPRTYVALQRQFTGREVDKRYVAWLEGAVAGERGHVELALRVDLDDRPRQIHDPIHGKSALTEWRVLARGSGRTRVALYPRTGRTHQLRVHAAHPLGLGAPVVGDRLYGRPGGRLLLHAEALAFTHPHTGRRLELCRPAPF